ncbi:hypothetical protein TELCIR_23403 [Teladorsagia circumcincta]|uniref:Uncharacterized protein n=1 Tax=Teladorsagia circumcincta TaxID=45464 RepID=A0A2G9TB66_TELCI|nr:hypothetical protein TELCIR_23403 [Teladorsagia circumcincta]
MKVNSWTPLLSGAVLPIRLSCYNLILMSHNSVVPVSNALIHTR